MSKMLLRGAAALVCAGLALSAAYAENADGSTCLKMDRQVSEALDTHANSPNRDAALRERTQGLMACRGAYYRMGVSHYAIALQLLGETPQG